MYRAIFRGKTLVFVTPVAFFFLARVFGYFHGRQHTKIRYYIVELHLNAIVILYFTRTIVSGAIMKTISTPDFVGETARERSNEYGDGRQILRLELSSSVVV